MSVKTDLLEQWYDLSKYLSVTARIQLQGLQNGSVNSHLMGCGLLGSITTDAIVGIMNLHRLLLHFYDHRSLVCYLTSIPDSIDRFLSRGMWQCGGKCLCVCVFVY